MTEPDPGMSVTSAAEVYRSGYAKGFARAVAVVDSCLSEIDRAELKQRQAEVWAWRFCATPNGHDEPPLPDLKGAPLRRN